MDTVKVEKNSTLFIAHRGLSGIERENTNAAFVAAGNRSYYGIETDVRRTADGQFVLSHDKTLERVSGVDVDVESSEKKALGEIVLYDMYKTKTREDLRVSSLENYIDICKRYSKHCVLELKTCFTQEEIQKIVDIIKSYDYLDKVSFISFKYPNLQKIREILPQHSAQFLFYEFEEGLIERLASDRIDVDVKYNALTKELVDIIHSKGLKVNCWTVDKKEDADRLIAWGVDYITTNILE